MRARTQSACPEFRAQRVAVRRRARSFSLLTPIFAPAPAALSDLRAAGTVTLERCYADVMLEASLKLRHVLLVAYATG
jgi:hypothetical protein